MIVFEYFYDKMNLFGPLIEEWAKNDVQTGEDVPILNHV